MNTLECIEKQFIEKVVLTLRELSQFLNVSIRTIQRKIRQWDTIRSYDHNGGYFSLKKLATFNSYGIWEYNNIHFSKFGTLKDTLVAIINNSSHGMDASQIRDVLGMDTRSFLFQYKDVSEIKRDKIGGNYVYFSSDQQQFSEQLLKRKLDSEALTQPPLKGSAAISVLVEAIKHPGFTSEQLSGDLHKQGIKIKPKVIQSFFAFYGIEKKTPDLR